MNKLPEKIHMLELTLSNICNSRCLMCDIGTEKFERREMSLAEIKNVLDSAIAKRANVISLCGGEPFLRKDFVDIVKLIRKKLGKFSLNVSSNGMDTEKIVGDISKIIDDANIVLVLSLDGLEKTHNMQRGVSDAFQRTMNTISVLQEKFPKIEINIHMTITPLNYMEIYDVYNLAKSRNLLFRASFAHNVCYLTNFVKEKNPLCTFTEEHIIGIEKQLRVIVSDCFKMGRFGDALFFNQIPKRMRDSNHRFCRCFTSSNLILIKENGDVHICVMSPPVGNINEEGLDRIFLSENAEKVRKRAEDYACPNCMMLCGSYFNYEAIGKLLSTFCQKNTLAWEDSNDASVSYDKVSMEEGQKIMCALASIQKNGKTPGISRPIAPCMLSLNDRKIIKNFNPPTSCEDCRELFVVDDEGIIGLCDALHRIDFTRGMRLSDLKPINKSKSCYAACNPFLRNRCFCIKSEKK